MTIEISNDLNEINLIPADEVEEISQNIKVILNTYQNSVPLDREFGVDSSLIDMPISAARAKATANITTAINTYEPRARVKSVDFSGNNTDGIANFKVTVELVNIG